MSHGKSIVPVVAALAAIAALGGMLHCYAAFFDASWLLVPSAKYRSVQKRLGRIQNEGVILANSINWKELDKDGYTDIVVGKWNIERTCQGKYALSRSVFRSGRLSLEVSIGDTIVYSWVFYPVRNSRPEYLYMSFANQAYRIGFPLVFHDFLSWHAMTHVTNYHFGSLKANNIG